MSESEGSKKEGFTRCRVLVVGSGPAGASAAYHLSRLGQEDVVVLDRLSGTQRKRYHSICGEAVSDRMMRRAGITTDHVLRRVSRIEIVFGDNPPAYVNVKGAIVERWAMLDELLASSKARMMHGDAKSVRRLPEGGFEVETSGGTIRCDAVIGADGAYSVVRKHLFGSRPEMMDPIVNTVVPGESGDILRFRVGNGVTGGYVWDFPSSEGMKSVGFPKGCGSIPDGAVHGARCIPTGRVPKVSDEGCVLAGDAAGLANPLCYGGIGAALLSGRKAAEAVVSGDFKAYDAWVNRDRMFDRRFMDAHRQFSEWTETDIERAATPLYGNANVFKGFLAILRYPKYSRVYLGCWLGFKIGW